MTTLVLEAEPVISNVIFANDKFITELADGRTLSVPLDWYPRLRAALSAERMNWHLLVGVVVKANARLNAG